LSKTTVWKFFRLSKIKKIEEAKITAVLYRNV
jgi:hypothetical protein